MTTSNSSFSLERTPLELQFRTATLIAREVLSPNYVRVRLEGDDLYGFTSLGSDDHMRLFFPDETPNSVEEMRAAPSREYTPLVWDENWLEVEFAIHGDEGVAARWAATAPLGSQIGVGGPRGSAVLTGTPGSWFLAGDETAIPAMRRFAALIGDQPARIIVEVRGSEDEITVDAPVKIEWLHRGDAPAGSALISLLDSLTASDAVGEDTFVFIAAEQAVVKSGRAVLARWGVDADRAIVKGYWKRDQ